MRGGSIDGAPTSRAAILSYDTGSTVNYISHRFVTKVLHEDVQSFEQEATIRIPTQSHTADVEGFVDLDWCSQHDRKQWHNTRFLVTTTYDPPYDAVLGQADAERYGMTKKRRRRR
jgi:hypothetical protein